MKNFQNKAKIINVSKVIRAILYAGLCLWIFAFFASLVPFSFCIFPGGSQIHPIQAYASSGSALMCVFYFLVNLKLFHFFERLKNGCLFDMQTVGCLDAAGKWCILLWFYDGLFYGIRTLCFQVKMNWEFGSLFSALTLIFVAWLSKEAQELQEEQQLTV
ncbi:MAG: hypothetical protein WCS42_08760 [Verrucomicrobiota bacterium]